MKKTLVSALTTALVVGAASTTFAAANPFADVPADHWAYDAVAQLVQDGVVNGYSADGTFKGDQNMSRYVMAQIVAKAMAKSDAADNNNKALIEKLSAEFSDELANLGVRVANLEAKTDNVKWTGLIRYDWNTTNYEAKKGIGSHRNPETNTLKLRFTPSITINENWTGYSEIDYNFNPDETGASKGENADNHEVSKVYAEGVYGKADIKLGRFGSFSGASHGLFFDDKVTGAEIVYAPTSNWKVKATGGRIDATEDLFKANGGNSSATYYGAEVLYNNGKLEAGVGYHAAGANVTKVGNDNSNYQVVDAGVGYAFDSNVKATVDYARGNEWANDRFSKDAYSIQVNYKGANAAQKGSWGAYVAYRSLTPVAAMQTTYDIKNGNAGWRSLKGWEIGADYAWAKNIVSSFKYFNGKDTDSDYSGKDKVTGVWSRVDFMF
ncbi:S-layer homology domain-containing protein [Anaerovibrio slackiae]|uniref:S-layer homology domain-containing protein n=1 Tax=Anaerovibrio slackiae TaxID=2652309 RepID=UPI003865731D